MMKLPINLPVVYMERDAMSFYFDAGKSIQGPLEGMSQRN
jgi:hypothetical protein